MSQDEAEGGKLRLLNPLSIRFSQPKIAGHFRDGHALNEAATEFYQVPLASMADIDRSALKGDSAPGVPTYDTVLVPPFPEIRVISWRPKIRSKTGEAAKDQHGDHVLGKRAWFALDNRRLYSMQCAAARIWPRRCCMVVRCIEEVPGADVKELRKFRTTTEGKSIELGVKADKSVVWSWVKEAPKGTATHANSEVEAEGLCAEDLWDPAVWAPEATAANAKLSGEAGWEEAPANKEVPKAAHLHAANGFAHANGYAPATGFSAANGYAAARGAAYPPACPTYERQCRLAACPCTGWEYVDPSGKIQGPFHLDKMRQWHQHGFFYPALPMRCDASDEFVPFADLWPLGVLPFTIQVVRHTVLVVGK